MGDEASLYPPETDTDLRTTALRIAVNAYTISDAPPAEKTPDKVLATAKTYFDFIKDGR